MSKYDARLRKLEKRNTQELFRVVACPREDWNYSGSCEAASCECEAARVEHMRATHGTGTFIVIPAEMASV